MPKKSRKKKSVRRSRSRRKSVKRKVVKRSKRKSRQRKKVVKMGVKSRRTPSSRSLRRTPYPPRLHMRQVPVAEEDVEDVPELAEEPPVPARSSQRRSPYPPSPVSAGPPVQPRRMPLVPRLIRQPQPMGPPQVLSLESLGLLRLEQKGVELTPVQTNQLFGKIMNALRRSFTPFLRQRSHGYAQVRPTAESILRDINRRVPLQNYVGLGEVIEPVQTQPSDSRYGSMPLSRRTIARIDLNQVIFDYLVRWGIPRQQYALR
jgi:hypothetical protein